jgi:polysaccharide deacetylase family protein (PEP-CTERM system associated)
MRGIRNALTVDVEDYFQVTAFQRIVERRHWGDYPSRVEANTQRLLELLARHDVRATFFILGWVARRFPRLVRAIGSVHHEIGCHGYWHRLIYQQTPEEFREDIREARLAIEDAGGVSVTAYRAPTWSITRQVLWALDILGEEGFEIDSSIFPIHHDRYGISDAKRFPHVIETKANRLREFPPSVVRWMGLNWPVSGGGYFRLYPLSWTCRAIKTINEKQGQPFLFYLHPWELDPEQPRLKAPWRTRWRHYVGLKSTERKLDQLLSTFPFGTLTEAWPDSANGTASAAVRGVPGESSAG